MPEKKKTYEVKITAGLVNSVFCNATGDVQAIFQSNDPHQIIPLLRDWMRIALRHPNGTHMTPEEADAVMDDMPVDEYSQHLREIGIAIGTIVAGEAQEFE